MAAGLQWDSLSALGASFSSNPLAIGNGAIRAAQSFALVRNKISTSYTLIAAGGNNTLEIVSN